MVRGSHITFCVMNLCASLATMANNNRLLNLPWDLFYKITNELTIFDLSKMEKSGLFELNEQGISDVIQVAFERLPQVHITISGHEEIIRTAELVLRCGTGLRSLIVKPRYERSFLRYARRFDQEFGTKLAASCPNIEMFDEEDYNGDDSGHAFRDYIRNIPVSKLAEINVIDLTHEDFQILFTPNLKSVIVTNPTKFMESMERLSVSHPNAGTSVERLSIFRVNFLNADNFRKLSTFLPNLKTINVTPMGSDRIKCVYNREQIYRPDFVYQLELIDKYNSDDLPYVNKDHGEKFDLSAITKYRPFERRFDASAINQLKNLRSLQLRGNDMMSGFSDFLSDVTFTSVKELNFADLNLTAENFAKFEKILLTGRFVIRYFSFANVYGVHSALIPLLNKYCPNGKDVFIELEPADGETITLSAVEIQLLQDVGISYELQPEGDTTIIILQKE